MDATIAERVKLMAEDRRHGAGWLARQAVEAFAAAVEAGDDPLEAARALASARPAIGAVAGALGRVLAAGRSHDEVILEECRALLDRRDRASHSIAVLLKPELAGEVMTHSASATVREALLHAEPARVICTATPPFEEGREFADELRAGGLAVDLVAGDDATRTVETVDVLLVGADTVFRDGALVNRVGTAPLAEAARAADVPVLVGCETIKLAPFDTPEDGDGWPTRPGDDEPFDLTPPDLIDRYVTDEGEFAPRDIAALVDQTPFLLDGYALLRE